MSRRILVEAEKTFRITVPDEAKLTFGPWSPSGKTDSYEVRQAGRTGTLRVYADSKTNATILGVWSGVYSFREENLGFEEQVLVEKGSIVWQNDANEYSRQEQVTRDRKWAESEIKELAPKTKTAKAVKPSDDF